MRRTLYLAAALIALLLVAVPVQAGEESGEKTLGWLDHFAVEINNTDGDRLRISYDVEVTDGVNVNIYFMDEEGYDDFVAFQNFSYFELYSVKDTDGAEKEWTWTKEGTFYVVIENAGWQSFDITTFDYDVEWDVSGSLWWGLPILWCLILLVVFGVIGIAAIWLVMAAMRARKESTAEGTRGEGGSGSPPPGEGETFEGAMVHETPPAPAEGETWEGARVHEPVPVEEMDTSPVPTTVPPPGEGAAELGPQPEPPDSPAGTPSDSGYTGSGEPPAPGTTTYPSEPVPTESVTELSPQPEPPDSAIDGSRVLTHGEGVTELSPQPEPPDLKARDDGLQPQGDGKTKLGPQPEPPD